MVTMGSDVLGWLLICGVALVGAVALTSLLHWWTSHR